MAQCVSGTRNPSLECIYVQGSFSGTHDSVHIHVVVVVIIIIVVIVVVIIVVVAVDRANHIDNSIEQGHHEGQKGQL